MPRRREVPKRIILPDPKFGSQEVAKFMNKNNNCKRGQEGYEISKRQQYVTQKIHRLFPSLSEPYSDVRARITQVRHRICRVKAKQTRDSPVINHTTALLS